MTYAKGATKQRKRPPGAALPIRPLNEVPGAEDPLAAALLARYQTAKVRWDQWRSIWQDCYELCLPNRTGFFAISEGQRNTLAIYDQTAVTGAQEFASKVAATMMPAFQRWVDLRAGPGIAENIRGEVDKALSKVTDVLFDTINRSNFHMEVVEAIKEMAMSTGVMVMEDGDTTSPVRTTAVPLTQVILDKGPFGETDFYSRPRKLRAGLISVDYPDNYAPPELQDICKQTPQKEIDFLEVTYRDWSVTTIETYRWCLIWKEKSVCIARQDFSGLGSCPWIDFSWAKDPMETYGRGPLLSALSSIKTANLTVQLTLENAEMAITGMYQYQDDGVINPDNVEFAPAALIPIDFASKGLQRLEGGGDFNVANLILADERGNIKRALYVGEFAPLDKTPHSATEVAYRQQDLAQRIGSSWGRLQHELITRVIQRLVYLLRRQGKIVIPRVDGHEIVIVPVSPLAKTQNQDDIMAIDRYLEQIGTRFGPNMVPLVVDPMRTAAKLANLYGIDPTLNRSAAEQADAIKKLQAAAAAQGPGAGQQAVAPQPQAQAA